MTTRSQTYPRGFPTILITRDRDLLAEGNQILEFGIEIIMWCRPWIPFCLRLLHGLLMWHDGRLERLPRTNQ